MVCKSVESLTALTRSRAQVLQVRKVILRHLRHHARKVLHGCKAIHGTEGIVRAKSYMSVMSFTEHGFTALAGLCAPDILDLKLYAALTQLCTHHFTTRNNALKRRKILHAHLYLKMTESPNNMGNTVFAKSKNIMFQV